MSKQKVDWPSFVASVILFSASVWLGLRKGIKRLSDINMWLAFVLLAFVLLVGPTIFLLNTSMNSVGLMAVSLVKQLRADEE